MKPILVLQTSRDAYSPEDVRGTMTVGELLRFLEDFDEDRPVFLSFDNDYTFGGIREYCFEDRDMEDPS